MNLQKEQIKKIEIYIENYARPLDRALYNFHTHAGSVDSVFAALAKFQNEDGGFGNAIEPDMRQPQSTSIATWFAFQYIKQITDQPYNAIIKHALNYLVLTLDDNKVGWLVVAPEVDDHPHAPWWNYDSAINNFGWGNPAAEVLGLFIHYGDKSHHDLIVRLTDKALERIGHVPPSDFHEIFCFKALYELADAELQNQLKEPLEKLIKQAVSTNPDEWAGYVATPLKFMNGPDDPFISLFEPSLIKQNIDFVISNLQDDHWEPNWTWQEQYPEQWEIAKQEWSGELTVKNLLLLKSFNT